MERCELISSHKLIKKQKGKNKMNIITKQSDKQVLDIKILKDHLRIDHDHEDAYLKKIISRRRKIVLCSHMMKLKKNIIT